MRTKHYRKDTIMFKIAKSTALGLIAGSLIGTGLICVLSYADNLNFEEKTRKMKQTQKLNDWINDAYKNV